MKAPSHEPIITHEMLFKIRQRRKDRLAKPRKGGVTHEDYHRIKQLLAEGVHCRAIAKVVGVSSATVSQIDRGHVPPSVLVVGREGWTGQGTRRAKREVCPCCGHRVPMPCVSCAALRYLKAKGGAA